MKKQYLGDSKDSFKWDYHDYLVSELNYPLFNIALMMTPNDNTNQGQTRANLFTARKEILDFCEEIRSGADLEKIKNLPKKTSSNYRIDFHKNDKYFDNYNRDDYFSNFHRIEKQLFFLDPDNGFEPEKSCTEKHVRYTDIFKSINSLPDDSIISVFQHYRYKPFQEDYISIKKRLGNDLYSTAIHWHSLMFVLITKSSHILNKIIDANKKYAVKHNLILLNDFHIKETETLENNFRNLLIKTAKNRKIINYGEIAKSIGLDLQKQEDKSQIFKILQNISVEEHKNNRPLLACLVVRKDSRTPGIGFFKQAKYDLGYQFEDDIYFFNNELKKTYEYWSRN